ncbi:MAG TPA: DUF4173 domain-containing protein [Terriglobia bacterium]|nr:DUF4173 domain-containing protein [Terriglobia bacterium]
MSETTKLVLKIFTGAMLLGVLGDELLRTFPWGLNAALWVAAFAVIVLALAPFRREVLAKGGYWLLVPAAVFSIGLVWRDSLVLKSLNIFALGIVLSLLILRAQGRKVLAAGLLEYGLGSLFAAINAMFSPFLLVFKDMNWKDFKGHQASRPILAACRGVLFSVPPVLIFGGLLVSADPVFSDIVENTLNIGFVSLFLHLFFTAFFAWSVSGYLRGIFFGKDAGSLATQVPKFPSLGIAEASIVLGAVDILFLGFVIVQLRYFFGGDGFVQKTIGMTYAEYARHGFFELVTVAALVMPMLLAAHWLLGKDHPRNERIFRALAGAQILLLFVIMASAWQRMRLYQQEYGMTELRLYTTAFMAWLAVVFVWFTLTVLRGNRKPFAFGAMSSGFLLVLSLLILNPDALIARTNTARALAERRFDATYVSSLSADAVPSLVQALTSAGSKSMGLENRRKLSAGILRDWSPSNDIDWRTWSLARAQAFRAVKENETLLRANLSSKK